MRIRCALNYKSGLKEKCRIECCFLGICGIMSVDKDTVLWQTTWNLANGKVSKQCVEK